MLQSPRPAVSWRSVTLGLLGVGLICALTPYNDYALNNTFLVGNNLPLGALMLAFIFVVAINGPLRRFKPDSALSSAELAVAFTMTLISCALPSSGLMRYFPPSLVAPFYQAQANREFLELLESLNVPRWLFPSFQGDSPRQWMYDPIVTGYWDRWTADGPAPYAAWIQPALTWGIFLAALFGALLCIVVLVRRQWVENERLAFPLAQIYLALLEQPRRGSMLNSILSRPLFWIAFGLIFALHGWNGMTRYYPQFAEMEIPVYYHLPGLFADPPWSYTEFKLQDSAVFFTVVGVTYFIPTPVAFSLWFFFMLQQGRRMWLGTITGDPNPHGQLDAQFGGVVAFALAIGWIGRHHWKLIALQALRGARPDEPRGRYLPYPLAAWGLLGCYLAMIAWLMLAGASFLASLVVITMLLMLFLVITRIVAEAGLVHGQLLVPLQKPWDLLVRAGFTQPIPMESYYLTSMLQSHHFDFREPVPVYASHNLKVADHAAFDGRPADSDTPADRRAGLRIIGAMALALLVGYFVSLGSTLWTEYRYAWTKDVRAGMVNEWGVAHSPQYSIVHPMIHYERGVFTQPHSSAAHFSFGFAFTALLSFLRLRYTWWPLHPIGFLMLGTFPGSHLWFSIFWGWLAKVLIMRLGGPRLYSAAKPFFLGLIIGESAAAGFWLIMGILLSTLGLSYRPVHIMPG